MTSQHLFGIGSGISLPFFLALLYLNRVHVVRDSTYSFTSESIEIQWYRWRNFRRVRRAPGCATTGPSCNLVDSFVFRRYTSWTHKGRTKPGKSSIRNTQMTDETIGNQENRAICYGERFALMINSCAAVWCRFFHNFTIVRILSIAPSKRLLGRRIEVSLDYCGNEIFEPTAQYLLFHFNDRWYCSLFPHKIVFQQQMQITNGRNREANQIQLMLSTRVEALCAAVVTIVSDWIPHW